MINLAIDWTDMRRDERIVLPEGCVCGVLQNGPHGASWLFVPGCPVHHPSGPLTIEDNHQITIAPPAGTSVAEIRRLIDAALAEDRQDLLRALAVQGRV